jgi:hypothetical protein
MGFSHGTFESLRIAAEGVLIGRFFTGLKAGASTVQACTFAEARSPSRFGIIPPWKT